MQGRHSLVREDTGDAPVGGCKDSQEAVPARRRAGYADHQWGSVLPLPIPILICPKTVLPTLGYLPSTYVLRSWSFQTWSTSFCVIPVSRIRLCRRKLSPWEMERR